MTYMTAQASASRSLLDIVERASLFALLQQAMEHHKQPQALPLRLHDDVGMPLNQRLDFAPHGR